MSEALIRAEIVSVLGGITDIGQVSGYKRPAITEKELKDRYGALIGGKNVIRGWTVSRTETPEERVTFPSKHRREYVYVIEGFWGLKDDAAEANASETDFQAMIETICATFRPLHDLNAKTKWTSPVQVRVVDHRIFGGVLTHHVELELLVREDVSA